MTLNGTRDTLYYINSHIYRHAVASHSEPEIIIESPYAGNSLAGYYGLTVDPSSSEIYVADAIDFVQRGQVYRFSPAGLPIDTIQVGIIPGAFSFK